MVFIYALACSETIWYVGSTLDFKRRFRQHRDKRDKGYGSDLIPESIKWQMIILDEVSEENRQDAERFYYEFLQPSLNKCVPGRSGKEYQYLWNKEHTHKRRQYSSEYYYENQEKVRERQRLYRIKQNEPLNKI